MRQENLTTTPRELKFGGEKKADDIKRGFAITTLRNPRSSYDFVPGERILADCFDSNEKVPAVILTNEETQLRHFSEPQLLLDGFSSTEKAIKGMRPIQSYENTNGNSPMQAITFVHEETYNALREDLKKAILNSKNDFDTLIKIPGLRHVFFPTMASTMAENGKTLGNWFDFLKKHYLISNKERDLAQNHEWEGEKIFQFINERSSHFREISRDRGDALFKPFILALFE